MSEDDTWKIRAIPDDEFKAILARFDTKKAVRELCMDAYSCPFWDFINAHPAFVENGDDVGAWESGDSNVRLNGSFTHAQLRAIADYMENNS